MKTELRPIDIGDSADLLALAEEVQRSGVGRILKHGEREIALITPVMRPESGRHHDPAADAPPDTILNIIGIGASTEPTDIARHEREYLAEAYDSASE